MASAAATTGFLCALCLATAAGPARSAPAAPASPVSAFDGKKLFTEKTCVTCHSVGAASFGVGPELTQVAYHRDREWLRAWLEDAPKVKKDTPMPKLPWKSPADGARLFQDYKCSACHAVARKGGKPQFPDLGGVGRRRTGAWLARWMADPQAVRKGTWEPAYKLPETQRFALVKYLSELK